MLDEQGRNIIPMPRSYSAGDNNALPIPRLIEVVVCGIQLGRYSRENPTVFIVRPE